MTDYPTMMTPVNHFPTRQLQPIAGLMAFYNEQVDRYLNGELLERPTTHFFT